MQGHQYNRKLLVSVYNAREAREAVLGGARIIDSEDPKSALGNISPRRIMDVSDAVLDGSSRAAVVASGIDGLAITGNRQRISGPSSVFARVTDSCNVVVSDNVISSSATELSMESAVC